MFIFTFTRTNLVTMWKMIWRDLEGPGRAVGCLLWKSRWEMVVALTKAVVEQIKGGTGSWGICSAFL